ncbi:MAG: hypothetical protein GF384_07795 [Elusimicrobia bacterium]|nr:hypothetical protein [Elusimicrobiota bacterium]MBD3412546.1 hypothetical protein [Elusimicrobiota bacterium]
MSVFSCVCIYTVDQSRRIVMAGFFDEFRKKIISSVWKDQSDERNSVQVDDKIALGVLLWIVAEADGKFLPTETQKIKQILTESAHIESRDLDTVLAAVEQAAQDRIDLYRFTHEINPGLPYAVKKQIIENLFRVACADHELAAQELETIRKIAGLFNIAHNDFIDAKLMVKQETGID